MSRIAWVCILCLAAIAPSQAADSQFSASLGLDYSSGKYGSQATTETWALPLSLKYRTDDWSLRLSTAWLRIHGSGNVTPDGNPLSAAGNASTTEGMGDVSFRATYKLVDERTHWAGLDLSGRIKFGTASVSKFLGTGENDYGVEIELFKPIDKWNSFLSLGYKLKGDPDAISYRNVWLSSIGTDYRITPTTSFGGSYDWQEAVTRTGSAISEITLYLSYQLAPQHRVNLYAVAGFSDASPA